MSDEQEKPAEALIEPDEKPQGPRCGELLAEARRERQISVVEVAKELHLDEPKVRALERNEFESLGAPVFAKGHLRKYAQIVGVDEDDVLTDYYQMTRQDSLPPVVVARRRMRQEVAPGPWIAAIVVIIVVAAAYWWFAVYSAQAPVTAPAATPTEPTVEQSVVTDETPSAAEVVETTPEPEVAEPAQPAASEQEETLADGETRLSLTFTGDCWTEISDASGRRLFFEMGRAGRTVEVTGIAPFAVLFGNVDNVSVLLNGSEYPVSTNNPGSRTARLTISTP